MATKPKQLKISTYLVRARKLIEDPDHWIKGAFAKRTPKGSSLDPERPDVTCFCAVGALRHVVAPHEAEQLLNMAVRDISDNSDWYVTQFNDRKSTTHADVLALYDAAIKRARKQRI